MNRMILLAGVCLLASAPATLTAQIGYENFSSMQGLVPVGSAIQQKEIIRLTPDRPWVAGAIWSADRMPVAAGFTTGFTFRITAPGGATGDPNRDGGADGLAFVIQNSSPAALGEIGHQIGYGGIPNSLAIELDTWNNAPMGNGDPNNNHISVQSAGKAPNSFDHEHSLAVAENIPRLDDGKPHTLNVEYLPGRMTISIDGDQVIDLEIDLSTIISIEDGSAWVGFTSATARAWENHDLMSWSFTPSVKNEIPTAPRIAMHGIDRIDTHDPNVAMTTPRTAFADNDPVGESTISPGGLSRRNATTGATVPMSLAFVPNPASSATSLVYTLPVDRSVFVVLHDIKGRRLVTLFEGEQQAGRQEIPIETEGLAEGTYTVTVIDDDGRELATARLAVVR